MTDALSSANIVSGVTYGVANEVLSLSGILNETRTYNNMFQLTQITVPGVLNMQYAYSPANNNGKIVSQTDVLTGEQITYTYDSLNRLATAVTSDNPSVTQWGYSYGYDGFGNLTDQNVIKGSAIPMNVAYNASTNRQTGDTADLNGNIGLNYQYDIENRLLMPGTSGSGMPQYGYDAGNKRIWRGTSSPAVDELTFWSGNQKWATYGITVSGSTIYFTLTGTNVYFGGRLIAKGTYNSGGTNDKVTLTSIAQDRLGSMNGKFYPYGQERPSATTNDKEKFTGYFRDASTGLDYADQRYHNPGQGRFMTPDRFGPDLKNPGTLNKYAYAGGDPVNHRDGSGNYWNTVCSGPADDQTCFNDWVSDIPDYSFDCAFGGMCNGPGWTPAVYPADTNPQRTFVQPPHVYEQMNVVQEIEMLDKAVADARKLIENNGACRDLFGSLADPSTVLDNIENGVSNGWLEVGWGNLGTSTWAVTAPMSFSIDWSDYSVIFNPVTITLNNDLHGPFASDSDLGRARTVIHELLHAYGGIGISYGLLNDSRQADPNFPALSIANDDIVKSACK